MSQYVLLIENGDWEKLSQAEMEAVVQKMIAWVRELRSKNQFVAGDELAPGGRRLTVNGSGVVDGPYAETKETIGGYIIVEADNYDQATAIARACPAFEHNGAVQVREVKINE